MFTRAFKNPLTSDRPETRYESREPPTCQDASKVNHSHFESLVDQLQRDSQQQLHHQVAQDVFHPGGANVCECVSSLTMCSTVSQFSGHPPPSPRGPQSVKEHVCASFDGAQPSTQCPRTSQEQVRKKS